MLTILISGACAIHLEPYVRVDRLILQRFSSSRMLGFDKFFLYVTWAGTSYILMPIVLAHAILLIFRTHSKGTVFLVGSYVGGSVLTFAVKLVFARPRPDLFRYWVIFRQGFHFQVLMLSKLQSLYWRS